MLPQLPNIWGGIFVNKIEQAFRNGKAFISFLTAGDPSMDVTGQLIVSMAEAGADIIEIGIPFSDPIAEGPVIQAANQRALLAGATTDRVFDMVGVVTERIDNLNQTGAVQVGGKLWSARSDSGSILESGEKVRTVRIEGVKLIVVPQEAAEPVTAGANLKEEK
jgi:hypothetical protein